VNVRWLWLFGSTEHAMTCREAVSLVTAYLDDALGAEDHERFEEHLDECPHCREHLQQIRATIHLTGSLRTEDLDPGQRADLMGLYRRWRSTEFDAR
jgi:anti-sigma factor RsiW